MTHGDQAKAKKGKSSQASVKKTSINTAEGRKSGGQAAVKAGKGDKNGAKKQQGGTKKTAAPSKKGSSPLSKEPATAGGDQAKARAPIAAAPGFSSAVVAAAFKRAVKKYPNAFRRLTD